MKSRRFACMVLALIALVAGILACNAPQRETAEPQAPGPSATPHGSATSPPQETPLSPEPPVSPETAPSPTNTPPAPTPTSSPTETPTPTTAATPGPLDFPTPTALDSWRALDDGGYEATIIVRITGGAPPYTVSHDLESFTTDETNPALVFNAQGCNALVHTIKVESDDGQSVSHGYYIEPPWCAGQ